MKIAIAGGSGFIGSHLINYFTDKQVQTIVISRSHRPRPERMAEEVIGSRFRISLQNGRSSIERLAKQIKTAVHCE